MTKYTHDEIITYLEGLREGDRLVAAADSDTYSKGGTYEVGTDCDGDLYIVDDRGVYDFINIGERRVECVYFLIDDGTFAIPTKAALEPFNFHIASVRTVEGGVTAVIYTDAGGLERLQALEKESGKNTQLRVLKRRLDALQAEIDALEASI